MSGVQIGMVLTPVHRVKTLQALLPDIFMSNGAVAGFIVKG